MSLTITEVSRIIYLKQNLTKIFVFPYNLCLIKSESKGNKNKKYKVLSVKENKFTRSFIIIHYFYYPLFSFYFGKNSAR